MNDVSVRVDGGTTKNGPSPKANFELPRFEIPRFEMPAAIRDFVEKGGTQTKENYEKWKIATNQVTSMVEASYSTAAKGALDYGLKVIEITQAHTNAAFDFIGKLVAVKSPSEAVELSTTHARRQFDVASAQGKELWTLAQKVATDVTEPIRTGMSKVLE